MKTHTPQIRSEAEEQILCVEYLDLLAHQGHKIKYTATAQNTFTRSWKQKAKNKAVGVKKGLPDIIAIINDTLVFIEMKKIKGGVVSPEQKEWIQALNEAGEYAYVCKGFGEFKELVDKIVEISKETKLK